jgi:hypothetical protein
MPSTQTSIIDGLSTSVAVKAPVKAVFSTNITLAGLQGYAEGDRVLVNGQSDAKENGIYAVSTGQWQRTQDANGNRDFRKGTRVLVESGGDGIGYELVTDNPVVIGTSDLVFEFREIDSALRADLASTAASSDGSRLVGYRRTEAGARARSVFDALNLVIHATDFVTFDGSTDDTAGWQNALNAAGAAVGGVTGAVILCPRGVTLISSTLNIPNRVTIRGTNKRGTIIRAAPSFTGDYMFTAANSGVSMFDNAFQDLTLDAFDVAGLGCVLSDAWQEGGGGFGVLFWRFRTYAVRFQEGDGGSASCAFDNCEFFGSTSGATAAIYVDDTVSSVASFGLRCTNCTFSGGGGAQSDLPRGIHMHGGSLTATLCHFESGATAVYVDGPGQHTLIQCKGSNAAVGVTNLLEVASTFTGKVNLIGCYRNGTTNYLLDNRSGGVGTITGRDPARMMIAPLNSLPDESVGAIWSAGIFDGTQANPTAIGFNVTSITKNDTGDYTVTETRARTGTNTGAPFASCNINDAIVRVDLAGSASYRIRIRVAGVPTDANEVKFMNVRVV